MKDKFELTSNIVTPIIIGLYAATLIAITTLIITHLSSNNFSVSFFLKYVGLMLIILVISIQSMLFYFKFIIHFPDTEKGHYISLLLVTFLLILVIVEFYAGSFLLISVGLALICCKVGQLYSVALKKNIGNLTKKYLRGTLIGYSIIVMVTLYFGVVIDFKIFNLKFFSNGLPVELKNIDEIINKNEFLNAPLIKENINSLSNKFTELNFQIDLMYSISLNLIFILILYGFYKFVLIRNISLNDARKELDSYEN